MIECIVGGKERPMLDKLGRSYENSVAFGLGFGAEKGHPALKKILDLYDRISFYNEDGTLNLIACPHYQTEILKEYGLDDTRRTYQHLDAGIVVYEEEVFSPKSPLTGKTTITNKTVSIHQFSMTWINGKRKKTSEYRMESYRTVWIWICSYGY